MDLPDGLVMPDLGGLLCADLFSGAGGFSSVAAALVGAVMDTSLRRAA